MQVPWQHAWACAAALRARGPRPAPDGVRADTRVRLQPGACTAAATAASRTLRMVLTAPAMVSSACASHPPTSAPALAPAPAPAPPPAPVSLAPLACLAAPSCCALPSRSLPASSPSVRAPAPAPAPAPAWEPPLVVGAPSRPASAPVVTGVDGGVSAPESEPLLVEEASLRCTAACPWSLVALSLGRAAPLLAPTTRTMPDAASATCAGLGGTNRRLNCSRSERDCLRHVHARRGVDRLRRTAARGTTGVTQQSLCHCSQRHTAQ